MRWGFPAGGMIPANQDPDWHWQSGMSLNCFPFSSEVVFKLTLRF
jgi:hypothetical protein